MDKSEESLFSFGCRPRSNILSLGIFCCWVLGAVLVYHNRQEAYPYLQALHVIPETYLHQPSAFEKEVEQIRAACSGTPLDDAPSLEQYEADEMPLVRIAKVSAAFGDLDPAYERALRTQQIHAEVHGYQTFVTDQELGDFMWTKQVYLLSVLMQEMQKPEEERLEWLVWVDSDTIIMNPCIPITAFLPPQDMDDIHFIAAKDFWGFNAGVFILRVNDWSTDLLTFTLGFPYYRPDVELEWGEQSAMQVLLNEEQFVHNVIWMHQRWFNAYAGNPDEPGDTVAQAAGGYKIAKGDWLLHFAGLPSKPTAMQSWLNLAEAHDKDWHVPYEKTTIPAEIESFWAEVRANRTTNKAVSG